MRPIPNPSRLCDFACARACSVSLCPALSPHIASPRLATSFVPLTLDVLSFFAQCRLYAFDFDAAHGQAVFASSYVSFCVLFAYFNEFTGHGNADNPQNAV
jgi:hypothetical protein